MQQKKTHKKKLDEFWSEYRFPKFKIELKQRSLTLFDRTFSNLTSFFLSKILNYFNEYQNWNFSVLWLNWTQTIQRKQNQTFFHVTYLKLISYFIGHKVLDYFNDFYNWYLSISMQKWVQTSKIKYNPTGHWKIWQHSSLFAKR